MAALFARAPAEHYTPNMDTRTSRVRRARASGQLPRLSLLLAVLTALMLASHATHLPLVKAGADHAAGARLGGAPAGEHGQDDGVLPCGLHAHCEAEAMVDPAHVPSHRSLCAAGVAAWARGHAPVLALCAVIPHPFAAPRLGIRTLSMSDAPTPRVVLQRAVLQVWRI